MRSDMGPLNDKGTHVLGANDGDDEDEGRDDTDEDTLHRRVIGNDLRLAIVVGNGSVQVRGSR